MRKFIAVLLILFITGCSGVQVPAEKEPELVQGTIVTDRLIDQITEQLQQQEVFASHPFQISRNDKNEIVCHVISDHHPFLIYDPEQNSAEINFTVSSTITTEEENRIEQRLLELICDGVERACTAKVTDCEKTRLWPVDEPEEGVSEQLAAQVRTERDRVDFDAVAQTAEKALFEIRKVTLNTQEYTYQKQIPYFSATEGFVTEQDSSTSFFEQQWEFLLKEENQLFLTGWMKAMGRDPLESLCMISEQYLCEDTGACYSSRNDRQITVPQSVAEESAALYLKEDLMEMASRSGLSVDLAVCFESDGVIYDGLSDPRYVILKETGNRDDERLQPVVISKTENEAVMTALIPCRDERFGMSENGNIVVLSELERLVQQDPNGIPVWNITVN